MRCRRAGRVILERELGRPIHEVVARQLALHLAGCPSCSARSVAERRLVAELAALRSRAPRTLDARPAVMQRIERMERIARLDDPSRGLGWATAAACALGLFLALTCLAALPRVVALARGAAGSLVQAWERAEPALLALFFLPFRLLTPMLELARGLGALLLRLAPLAHTLALCGCLVMLATIVTVVTRDLALGRPAGSRKEC